MIQPDSDLAAVCILAKSSMRGTLLVKPSFCTPPTIVRSSAKQVAHARMQTPYIAGPPRFIVELVSVLLLDLYAGNHIKSASGFAV